MTTRRGFIASMLAAATAPAFIKAEILMPVRKIVVPEWNLYYGVDDTMQTAPIAWSPAALDVGVWYDLGDPRTVWQDASGTIPARLGSCVARIDDKFGRGAPMLFSTGFRLEKDEDGRLYVG